MNFPSADHGRMLRLIEEFPGQLEQALALGKNFQAPSGWKREWTQIVFAGMGGSAIGADILRNFCQPEIRYPMAVNRGYTLPAFVGPETLLVISSYSGNTEETISAYREGKAKKASVLVLSSGGEIGMMAAAFGDPQLKIPGGFPPRMALGFFIVPLLVLFDKWQWIRFESADFEETLDVLRHLQKKLSPVVLSGNEAKETAAFLYGRYPVFYSASEFQAVALRWREQVEENAKALAAHHVLPEMNHNEIAGWENPAAVLQDFAPVFLRDSGEHPRVRLRMKVTQEVIQKNGFLCREVSSEGRSLLARIFSLLYKADYVSFYLAALYGADPVEIPSIDNLKKKLAGEKVS